MPWELALPLTAAGSGAAWAQLAAHRAGEGRGAFALRALLGGAAAFGIALCAYDVGALLGAEVRFERLARGDALAVLGALAIGLVEEGAKLAGILLVLERRAGGRTVAAAAAGVAAGFAALEATLVLHGESSAPALVRAALAPVAHALLAAPLAFGVALGLARPTRPWLPIVPALLASAALHGAADLSLALPRVGSAGYALALAAPALAAFARAHRRGRASAEPAP